jgi:hypothetical protein
MMKMRCERIWIRANTFSDSTSARIWKENKVFVLHQTQTLFSGYNLSSKGIYDEKSTAKGIGLEQIHIVTVPWKVYDDGAKAPDIDMISLPVS